MRAYIERLQQFIDANQRAVGTGGIGLLVLVLYSVFVGLPFGGHDGTRVRANFGADTSIAGTYQVMPDRQLIKGAPVRVNGVKVGAVTASKLLDGGRQSQIEMHVSGVTVHADASARLAFRTLLGGNLQIQLDPGSDSAPSLGDSPIPASRTGDQVAVDDLFDPFQKQTREDSRATFRGLRSGFSAPKATGAAIERLGPAGTTLEHGLRPLLGQQDSDLAGVVRSSARVVSTLSRDTPALSALVAKADQTLGVTNARRGDIGAGLAASPAALQATDRAVAEIDPTLDALDPLVDRLRPGARKLAPAAQAATPALRQANRLLARARPLLRNTAPTFSSLRRVAHDGVPLIRELTPTIGRLNQSLLPWLGSTDPERQMKIYEGIGPMLGAAASAASNFDSEGYFFYFPDEPTLRSIGPLPCAPDLSALQNAKCESLVDVLKQVFDGRGVRP